MSTCVRQVDWESGKSELLAIRYEVFVIGQNVPVEIEQDDLDPQCSHFLASDAGGKPIGTARVDAEAHVGRVAVLESHRGLGVGRQLMNASLAYLAENGHELALLNSQTSAAEFYSKLGFVPVGEEFMEAGIPHIAMQKPLR